MTTPTLLTFSTPTLSPTAILRLIRTPTLRISGTALAMVATPIPMTVEPPTCYETTVGSLWCLGLVRNTSGINIEQVMVRVYLVTVDGKPLAEREVNTAHSVIIAGGISPYGVLFDAMPDQAIGAVAMLTSALPLPLEKQNRITILSVANVKADYRNGVYYVTASLGNSAKQSVHDINVVVTLLTASGKVTGYRQQRLTQTLAADETFSFAMDVIPQGTEGTVPDQVEISAESWH